MNWNFILRAASIFCLAGALRADPQAPAIIPLPETMDARPGTFAFGTETKIVANGGAEETGRYLAAELRRRNAGEFQLDTGTSAAGPGSVQLALDDAALGKEGYVLTVAPTGVLVEAHNDAGLFYGVQSLLQLLPTGAARTNCAVPCVYIKDEPRFQWRGLMLDVSRHFFTKSEVEQLLDEMAWHKLNVFHWHLVDDQGWRIEIKKYPRLTEVGAWRKAIGFGLDPKTGTAYGPDGRYGGYYTQDDIREVVAYAKARHIMIVPEIEMPGHSSAALMAYPQFSCTGGPFTTDLPGGVFNGIYCAGNDDAFGFVEDVLTEVFAMFPGPFVHIGGDEVLVDNWKHCAKCQARMREEGLTKESELEGYFIRRVEKFINAHHRRLVGWSEIREGGLAANATVMDWVGGATEAATAGHDVVMSPLADCYFDHYQSLDHSKEPFAIGGYLPLRQVYEFEPIPKDLAPQYQGHILGAQANVWTEYMPSFKHVRYMVFPRLFALAEVAWSPKASRNWDDFSRRAGVDCLRLDELGVNHRALSSIPEPARPAQK
ncbi:MAG TPA: beta-N-acetylhexosaminidase [Verrucomicrobiae bacterium]|jgi:hexosaminidase|nr:beta-N-acetylhexosaminidase [Verrucomicrobiae bacterium]